MSPDANNLVAIVVTVCAILTAGAAVGVVVLARRVSGASRQVRDRLGTAASVVRRDGPVLRDRLVTATDRLDRMRGRSDDTERAMADLTRSLTGVRVSLERLTRGRLAMLIRGAGVASRAAQFALLWR